MESKCNGERALNRQFDKKKMAIFIILLSYLVIFFIQQIVDLPKIFLAFSSVGLILIVPFVWGSIIEYLVCNLTIKLLKNRTTNYQSLGRTTLWFLGVFALSILHFILASLRLPAVVIIASLSMAFIGVSLIRITFSRKISESKLDYRKVLWGCLAATFSGVIPFVYIRTRSFFPYQMGRDFLFHSAVVLDLESNIIIPKILNEGFESMLSIICYSLKVDPISLFWAASLTQYLLFSIGVYLLVYRVSKDPLLAFLSSLISGWVFGGTLVADMIFLLRRNLIMAFLPYIFLVLINPIEIPRQNDRYKPHLRLLLKTGLTLAIPLSIFITSNYYFFNSLSKLLPEAINLIVWPIFAINPTSAYLGEPFSKIQGLVSIIYATIIFVLLRLRLCDAAERGKHDKWFLLSLGLISLHFLFGIVLSILTSLVFVFYPLKNRIQERFSYEFLVGLFIALYLSLNLSRATNTISDLFLAPVESICTLLNKLIHTSSTYQFDFQYKIELLFDVFGTFFCWMFLITLIFYPVFQKKFHEWKWELGFLYIFSSASTLLYFAPIEHSYRFIALISPLFGFFSISLLYELMKLWVEKGLPYHKAFGKHRQKFYITAIGWILFLSLFIALPSNYNSKISWYETIQSTPQTGLSSFTINDIKVANLLSSDFNDNTPVLITDPHTLLILSGLTGFTYTINIRIFTSSTTTAPLYEVNEGAFRTAIGNFSNATLARLLSTFPEDAGRMPILIIVNNRTAQWIFSEPDYKYLNNPFIDFAGLQRLLSYSNVDLISQINDFYYVFLIKKWPSLQIIDGSEIEIICDNHTSIKNMPQLSYYDRDSVNVTLELSGYSTYNISIPLGYHYQTSLIDKEPIDPQIIENSFLFHQSIDARKKLNILFKTNLEVGEIMWLDDTFAQGWWSVTSRTGLEDYTNDTNGKEVRLQLKGENWDYIQIRNYYVDQEKRENIFLYIRLRGSSNCLFEVLILTEEEKALQLNTPNECPAQYTEFKLSIPDAMENGVRIQGLIVQARTRDGESAQLIVDYTMLAHVHA